MEAREVRRAAPVLVTVVVPTRNGAARLPGQFEALAAQDYDGRWEVVVADNGSTDDTRSVVDAHVGRLPGLRFVDASAHRGVGHARNAGVAASDGDFVVFCDDDDLVDPHWLRELADAARSADVVGGYLDPTRVNSELALAWRPHAGMDRTALPTKLDFLPFPVGANFGVWRDVLDDVGGWREDWLGGGEDIDFAWRAQLRGWRLGYAPEATVHYRYRDGLRALARQFYAYGRADAALYREFRDAGVRRPSLVGAAKQWARLALDLPTAVSSLPRRGPWVHNVAFAAGRLTGSVRNRVLCL